jgi:hypothetical protein
LVLAHIAAHALAEVIGAHVGLQHAQYGLALVVGDIRVEGVARVQFVDHMLHDGVRTGAGVGRHGLFLVVVLLLPPAPAGVALVGLARGHPGGEAFVQP